MKPTTATIPISTGIIIDSPAVNVPLYDCEERSGVFHPFEDKKIRRKFIVKVYLILLTQLSLTFGMCLSFNLIDAMQKFAITEESQALYILSIVGMIISMGAFICNPESVKKSPCNVITLSGFTLCMSYMLSLSTMRVPTNTLLTGLGVTTGITSVLTVYAAQTKFDFTAMGGYLLCGLFAILLTSVINMFFANSIIYSLVAGGGALVFSGFIVHDTQLIVGGNHRKYQYDVDDYVFAALSLYMDVINLFLFILELLMVSNNN